LFAGRAVSFITGAFGYALVKVNNAEAIVPLYRIAGRVIHTGINDISAYQITVARYE